MDAERFLSNTISILATSADLLVTIDNLARLAVSELTECCAIFIFENEQTVRRLAIANRTKPASNNTQADVLQPLDLHASVGPGHVLRTGECEVLQGFGADVLERIGIRPDEVFDLQTSLYLCMPIIARERTIGAMVFISAGPKKAVDDEEFLLMSGVANAAGVAIDNARLYQEAQEANRLKDEFVAMVSHELRTPLTPILGCIHLLRTAKLSQANFDRALEMIERHAHMQVQIVEDLLDASRIVAGKLHLTMKSVPLLPIVESTVESLRSSAQDKGVHIVTNFEEVEQPIDGDPDRLQQIIRNLLSNAIKFTPPEGRIEISMRADGDHVEIQVTDMGAGIPADLLPSIFDRIRPSSTGHSRVRSGFELSLAIIRHLVELHNGSIDAASAGPGQGAVFTLRFPFAARKAASATS